MRVKVKINDILAITEKATLLLIGKNEIWLPNRAFRFGRGRYIIVDKGIAVSKGIKFKEYMHIPEKMEPIYNQEAIDELKYDSK